MTLMPRVSVCFLALLVGAIGVQGSPYCPTITRQFRSHSPYDATTIDARVVNRRTTPVYMFWISDEGMYHKQGEIQPGAEMAFAAHMAHAFQVFASDWEDRKVKPTTFVHEFMVTSLESVLFNRTEFTVFIDECVPHGDMQPSVPETAYMTSDKIYIAVKTTAKYHSLPGRSLGIAETWFQVGRRGVATGCTRYDCGTCLIDTPLVCCPPYSARQAREHVHLFRRP
jgi:hypothetical protein